MRPPQAPERADRRMVRSMLDRLLAFEPRLRRRNGRRRLGLAVATMIGVIAIADVEMPGVSLAFGYALPIALGAYAFGVRVGVGLSILCVVLRRLCAGHAYGASWLYAGSALMLVEYLLLAIGVGLLGRAIRRLERHGRTLRHLGELGRTLLAFDDQEVIWRKGVEGSVRLTGAEGGWVATPGEGSWRSGTVFVDGSWRDHDVEWTPSRPAQQPGQAMGGVPAPTDRALQELGVAAILAVELPASVKPPRTLVVFRRTPRPFERPTQEVLGLFALHLAAALNAAAQRQPPTPLRPAVPRLELR